MMKTSIKILGVNFANSILDNSKWDEISDDIVKKIRIWNRVRLFERGNRKPNPFIQTVVHLTLGRICTIRKYTEKEYTISSGTRKMTFQMPSSTLHFDEWSRYFRDRDTIELSKNKMDSEFIKSQQCSLKKSHAVSIKLNSEL